MSSSFIFADKGCLPDHIPVPDHQSVVGHRAVTANIRVFTEFAPLKAIIIGFMSDTSGMPLSEEVFQLDDENVIPGKQFSKEVCGRAREILNNVSEALMAKGIHVLRAAELDHRAAYEVCGKLTSGMSTFNARDLIFFYDNFVIETPTPCISRHHEGEALYWILKGLRERGGVWLDSWRTRYDPEAIPMWEAANVMRIGFDLIYQVSVSGNWLGYENFRQFIEGKYNGLVRVHPATLYNGFHIDSTFTVLGFNKKIQKMLVLANPERVTKFNVPALFRGENWAVLLTTEVADHGAEEGYWVSTKWIAQNILCINSELVMMDTKQTALANLLRFYGIDSILVEHEVARTVGGGIHCMSNDFNREEEIDFESILAKDSDSLTVQEKACYFDPGLLMFLQQSGADFREWERVCNEQGRFPNFLTQHLSTAASGAQ